MGRSKKYYNGPYSQWLAGGQVKTKGKPVERKPILKQRNKNKAAKIARRKNR